MDYRPKQRVWQTDLTGPAPKGYAARAFPVEQARKLPWRWTHDVDAPDEDRMGIIIDAADEVVASDLTLADATFIVETVNRVAGVVCTCEWDDACPFHPRPTVVGTP